MGNLTLKDLAHLAIISILVGFSVWKFSKCLDLESEIKRKKAEIKQKEGKSKRKSTPITFAKPKGHTVLSAWIL